MSLLLIPDYYAPQTPELVWMIQGRKTSDITRTAARRSHLLEYQNAGSLKPNTTKNNPILGETKKTTVTAANNQQKITQESAAANASDDAEAIIPEETHSFLFYILLAIGGGMILNLMPCVFPVLSLKALSFAQHSNGKHSHQAHGWAYTAGVIG